MKKYILSIILCLFGGIVLAQRHSPSVRPLPPKTWNNTHIVRPVNTHPIAPVTKPRVVVKNYHLLHGQKFKFGYYYNGYNHNQWNFHYWDTRYGTFLYFDPYTSQYYYWCAPHFRFYPITYAPLGYVFPYVAQPLPPDVAPPDPPIDP